MIRRLAVASLLAALASGCVSSDGSQCGDDLVCPAGKMCAPGGGCIDSDLVLACSGKEDDEGCLVAGLPAAQCRGGICQASRCGDGRVTGAEECDADLLMGQTCQTLGYYDEPGLSCGADCRYDTSSCVGRCGDGIKNGDEQCDGADLAGATCFNAGFYKAAGLACKADCSFDTAACTGGRCGDGVVNGLEQCDGEEFNRSCASLGFAGAMSSLSCTSNCLFSNQSCLCWGGNRCRARMQRCACPKLGGCGCVSAQ